jgi:hypothetical protein
MRDHAHAADGQPVSLEGARSRRQRLERLSRLVARLVEVQAGLVEAVDRLERRTGPTDRRAQPQVATLAAPARRGHRGLRLAIQVLGALLAGLAVAVVFSSGQTLHPSMGMPPALADPTTTARLAITPGTAAAGGQPGGMVGGRAAAVGGQAARADGSGERAIRPPAVAAGDAAATSTTTTLPGVTSTTLPALPETTLPAVPTTTLCRNPKHCDDDG